MAFIFDHLTAFIVGAVLLTGLLFLQQRGQQSSIEATVRYQTETQAASFVETLSRDLENARTSDQSNAALGLYEADSLGGSTWRAFGLHGTAAQTDFIQFVTLADPDASTDGDTSTRSDLIGVAYKMEPTGRQVTARGTLRNVYQIDRYVYSGSGWDKQGGSPATVVGFTVAALPGGTAGRLTTLPPRVDVAVEFANETPRLQASDQQERAEVGLTRQGATARIYASGTGGRANPPNQGSSEIPRLPWVGEAPPPSGTPGGGGGGGGTGGTGGTGGGGSGGGTPPISIAPIDVGPGTSTGL